MTVTHHKFLVRPATNEVFSWHLVETETSNRIAAFRPQAGYRGANSPAGRR